MYIADSNQSASWHASALMSTTEYSVILTLYWLHSMEALLSMRPNILAIQSFKSELFRHQRIRESWSQYHNMICKLLTYLLESRLIAACVWSLILFITALCSRLCLLLWEKIINGYRDPRRCHAILQLVWINCISLWTNLGCSLGNLLVTVHAPHCIPSSWHGDTWMEQRFTVSVFIIQRGLFWLVGFCC